jgi:hypothetical protein
MDLNRFSTEDYEKLAKMIASDSHFALVHGYMGPEAVREWVQEKYHSFHKFHITVISNDKYTRSHVMDVPLDEVPLFINYPLRSMSIFARWRLSIAK